MDPNPSQMIVSQPCRQNKRAIASKFGRQNRPRRAPTRGAPTNCLHFSAKKPASSRQRPLEFATAHYDLHSSRRFALRRAPTRGAPTRFRQPHEVLSQLDAIALQNNRAVASKFGRQNRPRRAPTRGAPTNCLHFSAKKPASSRQRPLEFATAHYDLHSSRRFALRRAPTRGAPTRFRQPHEVLSQLDAIALDRTSVEKMSFC